jgi:hypothetical protein
MARAIWVKSSRKDHQCGKGHVIPKGDGYFHASPGYHGRTLYRCKAHPFRPSDLTTSLRSEPMAAVESFEDAVQAGINSVDDLRAAWDELTEALQSYVDQRQEALNQWENGNSQLEELLDTAQNALDEAEGWEPEDFADDEPTEDDKDSWGEHDNYQDAWEEWDEAQTEHVTEQVNEASEIAGGLDL